MWLIDVENVNVQWPCFSEVKENSVLSSSNQHLAYQGYGYVTTVFSS